MGKLTTPTRFGLSTSGRSPITGGSLVTNTLANKDTFAAAESKFVPEAAGGEVLSNDWQLLSRDQIEAEYGLTRRWLELAAHRGQGPPMVVLSRRMVRYRRADFEAWLATHVIDNSTS